MTRGQVRPSIFGDIDPILTAGLRRADLVELAGVGVTPQDSLEHGFIFSKCPQTILVDGVPSAMFGVAPDPHMPNVGYVWLLGTDRLYSIHRQFLRESEKRLDELSAGFELLTNKVHKDNKLHIRWLRWLGFSFIRLNGNYWEFARVFNV